MDPKTFTLGRMFAMKLHNHVEEVSKVTNMAIKELTIESEVKKLAEVWKDQTFDIQKYMKVKIHLQVNTLSKYLVKGFMNYPVPLSEATTMIEFGLPQGTEDRGYVLRATDEVSLLLEDMGLNLQSMIASPFVRPFLDEVRKWEQRISLIGECIEVWMLVQRKWMYLESIFIGSDDIRQQLPKEAKRFDQIDKAWLKIMVDTQKNRNVLEACSTDGR